MIRLQGWHARKRSLARYFAVFAGMLLSCSGIVELASAADAGAIAVELNKLETDSKSCRAYIVVGNPSEAAIQILKLELILFRPDAVIERRLAVDLGPVRPNKKSVKTFELEALPCETIGSILVNDVIDCRDATGPLTDCLARLTFSSRAPVQFSK